jgi:hypothetical protein
VTNTPDDIAARVAGRLGLPPDAPDVIDATDAAISLATNYVYGSLAEPTQGPMLDLDDPLHVQGLTALAVRLAKSPDSPAGMLESDTYTGTPLPGDPMAEVHHLFDPARDVAGAFGIA